MAKLTTRKRKRLKKSSFAIPSKRAYPIMDRAHAISALSRVAQHGTPTEKAQVRRAVHRKYPGMQITGLTTRKRKGRKRK